MNNLLDLAIKGHGGRSRWEQIARIVATTHGPRMAWHAEIRPDKGQES